MRTKDLKIMPAAAALLLFVLALTSSAQTVQSVPFYRIFAHATGIHFWTTDVNRKLSAQGAGWSAEGTPFYILKQQAAGTVPLYVLTINLNFLSREGRGDVFLYTTHEDERAALINSPAVPHMLGGAAHVGSGQKWIPDGTTGIAGYIAASQLPGTVPLYRLYHPPVFGPVEDFLTSAECKLAGPCIQHRYCIFSDYDALLTTSEQEKASALKLHGYQYVETVGYVWPSAMAVSMQPPPPPKKTTQIDTSGKPVNADLMLLNAGCTRTGVGQFACSNLGAFNACNTFMKDGRTKGCTYTGNAAVQNEMDKTLFGLGCKHLLGRSDEFICITATSFNTCQSYVNKKQAKRCVMAKQ